MKQTKQLDDRLEFLRRLCDAFGPSGCEDMVRDMIRDHIDGCYDEIIPDKMGSLIAVIRGSGESNERVMLSSHMDEVGFMVRNIEDSGLIRFASLMGGDTRIMAGRKVVVGYPYDKDEDGKNGRFSLGVMAIKPIHMVKRDDRDNAEPLDQIFIDIGAASKEEAEKYVKVGDYGTFVSDFVVFGENDRMMKAKALDDRLGCAIMCNTMKKVWEDKKAGNILPYDLYFAFTCREELGISGAKTATHIIRPTMAMIFEATAVADIAGVPEISRVAKRGEGGAVSVMDRSTIYSKEMIELVLNTAKEENIPCQIKKYVSGGNDAGHIHKAANGTKCVAISAPCGYIHTASDVVSVDDYYSMTELAYKSLKRIK